MTLRKGRRAVWKDFGIRAKVSEPKMRKMNVLGARGEAWGAISLLEAFELGSYVSCKESAKPDRAGQGRPSPCLSLSCPVMMRVPES